MANRREKILISYSHADRIWLDRLNQHLTPLANRKNIPIWEDTMIATGAEWREAIDKELKRTKVAVFLMSPNFFDSKFIGEVEMKQLLASAKDQAVQICCIQISASVATHMEIGKYQFANSEPLARRRGESRNRAILAIAEQIVEMAEIAISRPAAVAAPIKSLPKRTVLHKGAVQALVFSRDGQMLASGSSDHSIVVSKNGRARRELTGHKGAVMAVAFAPDDTLLSASRERVRVWSLPAGSLVRNIAADRENFAELAALAPRSQKLAVYSGGGGGVQVFDLHTSERLMDFPIRVSGLNQVARLFARNTGMFATALAFSPVEELLAFGTNLGGVFVYDTASKILRNEFAVGNGVVTALTFSNDDRLLAAGAHDSTLVMVDLKVANSTSTARLNHGPVVQVAFASDGRFAVAFQSDTVRIYQPEFVEKADLGFGGRSLTFSPDGSVLAVGNGDGSVHFTECP